MSDMCPPEVASIMGAVDTFLRHRALQQQGNRQYVKYHPSEWGKCLRKQQYHHYAELKYIEVEEEVRGSQSLRLFDKGHNMHFRWQEQYFGEMGVLRGRWKCKNPFCYAFDDTGKVRFEDGINDDHKQKMLRSGKTRMHGKNDRLGCFKPKSCACGCQEFAYVETPVESEELNFAGRADLILDFSNITYEQFDGVRPAFNLKVLPKTPIVADMKTCNDWSYKSRLKQGPHSEYLVQVAIYAHILDLEFGLLIYENKNDSSLAAFRVDRNDAVFDTVQWQSKLMQKMAKSKALPPPKPESKDEYECKYCPFKDLCHASKVWEDPDLEEKRKKFYKNLL